jgi:DNA-binding CsgD family transcriptional regulator
VLLNMALAYGAQGRLDEAEALVDEIVGLAESAQARTTAALAEANFGEALMQAGRLDEAEARLLHALDLSGAAGELAARLVAHGALADVYLRQGRTQIARDQVRLSLQIARGQQRKYPLGDLLDIASRIEAAAGQWEEAYAFRSEQVACDRELARERLKLLTHYSADRLGIRAAAAGPRRRPPAEDGVDAAAAAQQTSAPAAPAEPLSPQQQRVLHLLAQGQSNKRIAANLGLSPLTVRHHVSEILARLGVRTRTEAAALAARLPDRQAP